MIKDGRAVSYDVRLWKISVNKSRRKPYEVRWVVGGRSRSRSHLTKALAERFRSDLLQAAHRGEVFDRDSGEPESMWGAKQAPLTWLDHAREYVAMKWPNAAPKTRESIADGLATVSAVLVVDHQDGPRAADLRAALKYWVFNLQPGPGQRQPSRAVAEALGWVDKHSAPLAEVADHTTGLVRLALDACLVNLDGSRASASTYSRKRRVFFNALQYGIERGRLEQNPVRGIKHQAPKIVQAVDRRVVVNPEQAQALLAAVPRVRRFQGRRLVAFYGCLYYAGLRPAEATALREPDCRLPAEGWGSLTVVGSEPSCAKGWTNNGRVHERRPVKHRAENEIRIVPIPPELVRLLREHIAAFGVGEGGRLFVSANGNPVSPTTSHRVWAEARVLALTEAQAASALARRPYDLRHAAASLWLNAGADPSEVAERLGHSLEVMLKIYVHCVDGRQDRANARIQAALSAG